MMIFVIVAMVIDGSGCGYLLSSFVGRWVKYAVVDFTPLASWRRVGGRESAVANPDTNGTEENVRIMRCPY